MAYDQGLADAQRAIEALRARLREAEERAERYRTALEKIAANERRFAYSMREIARCALAETTPKEGIQEYEDGVVSVLGDIDPEAATRGEERVSAILTGRR